ncbi:MAG: glycosyltransferase family 1 protein [Patescibacteria group bacterium]|jgi:glycosyltransferase involved in cell wall biosynthesis
MIRVGVDASQANAANRTGTEWYAFDLLHALAEIRQSEEYILYIENPLRDDLKDLGSGFTTRELHWPLKRFWHQGRLSVEMLTKKPDVFFAPAHALPLIQTTRSVTTIHDIGFEDFPELYPTWERRYHAFALRHALRTAERVIVPSHFTLQRIQHHFSVDVKRFVVIHHGFHLERYSEKPTEEEKSFVRKKYGLHKPFLLFIGRIEQKKNVPNLVRAFAEVQRQGVHDVDLVLAGGDGFGADVVEKIIRENNLHGTVHRLGYTDAGYLRVLMHMAKGFAFVSNYEGFGFPVLEAFAAGTPVLISRAGSLPEIAGEAALSADPKNVQDIAAGLYALATNDAQNVSLREKGHKQLAGFSWKSAALKTRNVLLQE